MDKGDLALRLISELIGRLRQSGAIDDEDIGKIVGEALGTPSEVAGAEFAPDEFDARLGVVDAIWHKWASPSP